MALTRQPGASRDLAASLSLRQIKALIIDMDGVLWRGSQTLQGVADFFSLLRTHRIAFLLATNNATRTTEDVLQRVLQAGIPATAEQILTSAEATARLLLHEFGHGAPILFVGEFGLRDTLVNAGLDAVDPLDPGRLDQRTAAVVVGLDRTMTYEKLRRANLEIRAGAKFIATNTDATLPTENGLIPGAGSIVAAVQTASATLPLIIGKPHKPLFDAALEIIGSSRQQTAMLGDRLDTDILGGHDAGIATILVLTGVTSAEEAAQSQVQADWTFPNLDALRQAWAQALQDQ
jgi:4-nitrophenyl phosphatase